jgi:hypothetical protein
VGLGVKVGVGGGWKGMDWGWMGMEVVGRRV